MLQKQQLSDSHPQTSWVTSALPECLMLSSVLHLFEAHMLARYESKAQLLTQQHHRT